MSDFIFDGFEPANTTPVPDRLFDELLTVLSGAELKALLYIMRRTWGFKKETDAISLSQFEKGITTKEGKVLDKGCGLSRDTICRVLHSLEEKGCIVCEKRQSAHGDSDVTIYRPRFKEQQVVGKSNYPRWLEKTTTLGDQKIQLPQSENPTTPSRKIQLQVVGKSNPQLNSKQETVIQGVTIGADALATTTDDFLPSEETSTSLPIAEDATKTPTEITIGSGLRFPGSSAFRRLGSSATIPAIPASSVRKPPVTPIRLVPPTLPAKEPPQSASGSSHFGYRKETDDVGGEQQKDLGTAPPETPSVQAEQQQNLTSKQGKVTRARKKKEVEPPPPPLIETLTPEAKRVWQDWCSMFTVEVELGPANAKAAEKLVATARVWCPKLKWTIKQLLKDMKDKAFENDRTGYYKTRGVKLFDIQRELEGWQSAKERELEEQARAARGGEQRTEDEAKRAAAQQVLDGQMIGPYRFVAPETPKQTSYVFRSSSGRTSLKTATS